MITNCNIYVKPLKEYPEGSIKKLLTILCGDVDKSGRTGCSVQDSPKAARLPGAADAPSDLR
jgi:hypothetical protein